LDLWAVNRNLGLLQRFKLGVTLFDRVLCVGQFGVDLIEAAFGDEGTVSTGDTKALQDQITQLQTDNANQKKAHEAELKALKIGNAVDMALTGAKAKNNTAWHP